MAVGTRKGAFVLFKGKLKTCQVFLRLIKSFFLRARLSKNLTLVHPFPSVEGNVCMNGHFVTLKSFFAAIIFSNFWDINE